jgi:hypothetical protein
MIYFIRAGYSGPVKIGRADDPRSRLEYLQTGHYETLEIVRSLTGDFREERWLHQEFANLRIRGEWFHFSPDMLTVVPPQALTDEVLAERGRGPLLVFDRASDGLDEFRQAVEAALVRYGIPHTTLGIKALGDPGFVGRLRNGRSPNLTTIGKVNAFLASLGAA